MILIESLKRLASEAQGIARSLECMNIANDGFECLARHDLKRCKQGVYFIATEGANAVKIGISKALKRRLSALQLANPHRLKVWRFINCDSYEDARRLEGSLHKYYSKQNARIRGEWFLLDMVVELFDEEVSDMLKQNIPSAKVIEKSVLPSMLELNHAWSEQIRRRGKIDTPKLL